LKKTKEEFVEYEKFVKTSEELGLGAKINVKRKLSVLEYSITEEKNSSLQISKS
jgi:hypothetical protein